MPTCKAKTKTGKPCRNSARPGSDYCGVHAAAAAEHGEIRKEGASSRSVRQKAESSSADHTILHTAPENGAGPLWWLFILAGMVIGALIASHTLNVDANPWLSSLKGFVITLIGGFAGAMLSSIPLVNWITDRLAIAAVSFGFGFFLYGILVFNIFGYHRDFKPEIEAFVSGDGLRFASRRDVVPTGSGPSKPATEVAEAHVAAAGSALEEARDQAASGERVAAVETLSAGAASAAYADDLDALEALIREQKKLAN